MRTLEKQTKPKEGKSNDLSPIQGAQCVFRIIDWMNEQGVSKAKKRHVMTFLTGLEHCFHNDHVQIADFIIELGKVVEERRDIIRTLQVPAVRHLVKLAHEQQHFDPEDFIRLVVEKTKGVLS